MKTSMQFSLAAVVCVVALAAAPTQAALPSYSAVYAFGDSLSDNGLAFSLTGGLPQAPYWNGRFSNGPVAVEYFAQGLGAPLVDLAIGGATTGAFNADIAGSPTGVLSQLAFYKSIAVAGADPKALYFVWAGPNDFLSADPANFGSTAQAAINNLQFTVGTLYGLGARHFFLPLMPDLGLAPFAIGSGQSAYLSLVSQVFDQALANAYSALGAFMPGADLTIFNTPVIQGNLTSFVASLGYDVTTPCFTGYVGIPGTVCPTPATSLYWDPIHPTTVGHYFTALAMLGALPVVAVPEPATMLMMGVGVLALIGLGRKRQS